MKRILAAILFSGAFLAACNAQQPPVTMPLTVATAVTQAQIESVTKALEARFPSAPIKGLRGAPTPGLFEVMIGDEIIYVDEKVTYYFVGNLIHAASRANLTEARQSELTAIDVKTLPLKDAIKIVRGKGERVMYVFTDSDCPYCTRLEQTLQTMDNITVYNFFNPIDSLHPDAGRKSKLIWCSEDRVKAFQDYMLNNKLVTNSNTTCDNPVDSTKALGAKLGVRATPSFFLADGRMVAGALPKEQLETKLNSAVAKVATK